MLVIIKKKSLSKETKTVFYSLGTKLVCMMFDLYVLCLCCWQRASYAANYCRTELRKALQKKDEEAGPAAAGANGKYIVDNK